MLEQIVGDIEDEYDFDENEDNIIPELNGRYRVKAQTEIGDFNEHFGSDFADDEFDTVGGLVLQAFGRLPKRGELVTIGGFRFRVVRADSRRLYTLNVERVTPPSPEAAAGSARARRAERGGAGACNAPRRLPARPRRHRVPGFRGRRRRHGRADAPARRPPWHALLLAAVAGAATVFGVRAIRADGAAAAHAGRCCSSRWRDATPRQAAWLGFAFGLGLFGAGVSWVSIALHTFGGMPAVLAAIGTARLLRLPRAVAGPCRLAGGARHRAVGRGARSPPPRVPGRWPNGLRGFVLSGFRWLSIGYAQLPGSAASAFAGYAPVGGVFLVSLAMAGVAAAGAALVPIAVDAASGARRAAGPLALIAALVRQAASRSTGSTGRAPTARR